MNECAFSAFEGLSTTPFESSSTTFEGSLHVSYNTNLLTFVILGVDTCIYRLQHAYKICNLHTKTMRCSCLLGDKYKFNTLMQGSRTTKSPKYIILLHDINIRMLHLTFECCKIRRFIRM